MDLLLRHGADVNQKDSFGITPLCHACRILNGDAAARILLQWGANKDPLHGDLNLSKRAETNEKWELSNLLCTPLGGRRCELVGLERYAEMNGHTGIAGKYSFETNRYDFVMEETKEHYQVPSDNLKRRDRNPNDPGLDSIKGRPQKSGRTENSISPTTTRKDKLIILG